MRPILTRSFLKDIGLAAIPMLLVACLAILFLLTIAWSPK